MPESTPMPIEIDATALGVGAATQAVTDALQDAVARGVPFTAVVRAPPVPRGGIRVTDMTHGTRMLKLLRPGLRARCRGLAFVVDERTLSRYGKVIRTGDRVWGCPTSTGADLDAARSWATARLPG